MQSFSFIVSNEYLEENNNVQRVDMFLTSNFDDYSRTYIQKIIKEGNVVVNGKVVKSNYLVKENDEITITIDDPKEINVVPQDLPIDIVYEDEDLIIVNKPKGMVVHPAPGNYDGTLVNALLYHSKGNLSDINGILRPGIVHRIDKDTAGILVIAKNSVVHRDLTEQFKVHSITRKYHAIVCGEVDLDEDTINLKIGRSDKDRKKMAVTEKNSKDAITHYKVLERFKKFTYIECTLETGRTHQIRVHMSHEGFPLLGDEVYGREDKIFNVKGQALFAKVLGFIHPTTNKYVEFEVPLSLEFEEILEKLRKNYK